MNTAQTIGLSTGNGNLLGYAEIKAWSDLSGVYLTLWEAETLKLISSTYMSGLQKYSDEKAKPPYLTDAGKERLRQENMERLSASLDKGDRLARGIAS